MCCTFLQTKIHLAHQKTHRISLNLLLKPMMQAFVTHNTLQNYTFSGKTTQNTLLYSKYELFDFLQMYYIVIRLWQFSFRYTSFKRVLFEAYCGSNCCLFLFPLLQVANTHVMLSAVTRWR